MEQNIKEIIDRIPREADIQVANYQVVHRITDVNSEYLKLIEKAVQIGSKVPISGAEDTTETFTSVPGSNVFERTIKNVPITRVDIKLAGSSLFTPIANDQTKMIQGINLGDALYWADEKRVFVENGLDAEVRMTYARGGVSLFTQADYALTSGWPTPDWIPATFHDLLWLKPAYRQASYYKKDRAAALGEEYSDLMNLFNNHYGRESAVNSSLVVDDGAFGAFGGSDDRR